MFPLFPLGQIVATPGALAALERAKQPPTRFLARHAIGDWGELEPTDVAENEYSVAPSSSIISSRATPRRPRSLRASTTRLSWGDKDRARNSILLSFTKPPS